jgi:hypothetical protein
LKKRLLAATAATLMLAVAQGGNPAQATTEGPYTIKAGAVPTWPSVQFAGASNGSYTETVFSQRRCDPSLMTNPAVQGADAYILDVSQYVDKLLEIKYTWDGNTGTRLYGNIYNGNCRIQRRTHSPGYSASPTDQIGYMLGDDEQSAMYVEVGTGSRWMVVAPELKVGVTFTVTAYPIS